MREFWIDGQDVPFESVRSRLPRLAKHFPPASIVRDRDVLADYRTRFAHCQLCGIELLRWDVKPELHHIVGGAGRSDEPTNLIMLCNGFGGCHAKVQGDKELLPVVLAAKCLTDRVHTDWVRLSILYGRFLPAPEWPSIWSALREVNMCRKGP